MRSVVRAAYSGRWTGSSDSGVASSRVKRLEQSAARFAEKGDEADDEDDRDHVPAGREVARERRRGRCVSWLKFARRTIA